MTVIGRAFRKIFNIESTENVSDSSSVKDKSQNTPVFETDGNNGNVDTFETSNFTETVYANLQSILDMSDKEIEKAKNEKRLEKITGMSAKELSKLSDNKFKKLIKSHAKELKTDLKKNVYDKRDIGWLDRLNGKFTRAIDKRLGIKNAEDVNINKKVDKYVEKFKRKHSGLTNEELQKELIKELIMEVVYADEDNVEVISTIITSFFRYIDVNKFNSVLSDLINVKGTESYQIADAMSGTNARNIVTEDNLSKEEATEIMTTLSKNASNAGLEKQENDFEKVLPECAKRRNELLASQKEGKLTDDEARELEELNKLYNNYCVAGSAGFEIGICSNLYIDQNEAQRYVEALNSVLQKWNMEEEVAQARENYFNLHEEILPEKRESIETFIATATNNNNNNNSNYVTTQNNNETKPVTDNIKVIEYNSANNKESSNTLTMEQPATNYTLPAETTDIPPVTTSNNQRVETAKPSFGLTSNPIQKENKIYSELITRVYNKNNHKDINSVKVLPLSNFAKCVAILHDDNIDEPLKNYAMDLFEKLPDSQKVVVFNSASTEARAMIAEKSDLATLRILKDETNSYTANLLEKRIEKKEEELIP